MKTVGTRKQPSLTFSLSAEHLKEGCRFNDEIHRLPTGNTSFIPKGLYRFKTLQEANHHQQTCLAQGMAAIARKSA